LLRSRGLLVLAAYWFRLARQRLLKPFHPALGLVLSCDL
jgi:hypothetical protein